MRKTVVYMLFIFLFVPIFYAANAETIKQDLLALKNVENRQVVGTGTDVCVIVQTDAITQYVFRVKKQADVSVTEEQCGTSTFPGIIVKFHSYEAFKRFQEDPKNVLLAGFGVDYTLHESAILEKGGILKCTEEFKKTYCPALINTVGESKLGVIKADCCMTGYQAAIHSVIGSSFMIWYVLIGIIIVISLLGLLATLRKEKTTEVNQTILTYVKTARQQGYDDTQIKTVLLQAGWREKDVDVTMKKSNEVSWKRM